MKELIKYMVRERNRKRIKQVDLAEVIGCSQNYLSKVETMKEKPSHSFIEEYCKAIGTPLIICFFYNIEEDLSQESKIAYNIMKDKLVEILHEAIK